MGRLTEFFAARNKPSTRRRTHLSATSVPRRKGSLEVGYDPAEWPIRVQAGTRVCQLLDSMTRAYKADDRATFDKALPVLRQFYDALHEPGDSAYLLEEFYRRYWPDWRNSEQAKQCVA